MRESLIKPLRARNPLANAFVARAGALVTCLRACGGRGGAVPAVVWARVELVWLPGAGAGPLHSSEFYREFCRHPFAALAAAGYDHRVDPAADPSRPDLAGA